MVSFFNSIRFKIALITSGSFLMLIIFTLAVAYQQFNVVIKEQAQANAKQITDQLCVSFDSYIKQLSHLSVSSYIDKDIADILADAPGIGNYTEIRQKIDAYFLNIYAYRDDIKGIAFSLENGKAYSNSYTGFSSFGWNFSYGYWRGLFTQNNRDSLAVMAQPGSLADAADAFVIMRELLTFETRQTFGYMMFWVNKHALSEWLSGPSLDAESSVYVLDPTNVVIFTNDKSETSLTGGDLLARLSLSSASGGFYSDGEPGLNAGSKLIVSDVSSYTGCRVIAVFEPSILMWGASAFRGAVLIAGCLSFAVVLFVSLLISFAFSKEIYEIMVKLNKTENGSGGTSFCTARKDEIGGISNAIGGMLEKIDTLQEKELNEVRRANEAVMKLKEAEYKLLQRQINPHFLYNTLDSIRMRALINKDAEVSEMVRMLAKFFRLNTLHGQTVVSVGDELEAIYYYLELMRVRYADKILYSIEVEEAVRSVLMPKLILQPIVENAIIHGLEPKSGSCEIRVTGRHMGDTITLRVYDSGLGITREGLAAVIRRMNDDAESEPGHIGLLNVNRRLKLSYGDSYKLSIKSEWTKYTEVTLVLPSVWLPEVTRL